MRGGILGDEPGLGKTITVIALLLKTRRLMPLPPPGVSAERDAFGTYYLAPPILSLGNSSKRESGRRSLRVIDASQSVDSRERVC